MPCTVCLKNYNNMLNINYKNTAENYLLSK